MKRFDFRRGMARLGFFTLAIWEILAVSMTVVSVRTQHSSIWDVTPFFLFYAVLIPGLIWLLWRVSRWVGRGFFRGISAP